MGFGDFFKDAWNWTKGAATDVWNDAIKPVGGAIFDVAKPVVNTVTQAVSPVIGAVGRTGGRLIDASGRFAEGTMQNVTNLQSGLTSLATSPFLWLGAGLVAIIVLPKIVDRL